MPNPRFTRRRCRALAAATGLAVLTVAGLTVPASATSTPSSSASQVVSVPISFTVRNVNRSDVACASDGRTYRVRGDLVAPRSALRGGSAVTLYLHGLSFGEYFWNFDSVAGYNYARTQAARGLTSVVIDRLGYGKSDKPAGKNICAGSRADVAHQMVLDLRDGHYQLGHSRTGARFHKVFLAGHSYGGQIAELEAYSSGDIAGLIVVSYTDVGQSRTLDQAANYTANQCLTGGQKVTPRGPGGYSPFGDPSKATATLFHNVSPAVLKAAKPKLSIDPCGDSASFPGATTINIDNVSRIHVPTLLIAGGADKLFPPPALNQEARLFTGASDLQVRTIPNTAHAVTLERTHSQFASAMFTWLRTH